MKKIFISILILVIIIVTFCLVYNEDSDRLAISFYQCIDGDTAWFLINNKREKIRFLGIDTPEISGINKEEFGIDARDYTCSLLENANKIELEYDKNSEKYDKYNRMLAWIFIDDKNISELLLKNGLAQVKYIYGDYQHVNSLCLSQKEAYDNKLGIWKIYSEKDYQNNYCLK